MSGIPHIYDSPRLFEEYVEEMYEENIIEDEEYYDLKNKIKWFKRQKWR